MGSTRRLKTGRWQARWRDELGVQRKASFDTKAEAEDHLARLKLGLKVNRADDATVSDWAEKWLRGRGHLKPKTLQGYESLLRKHILPVWGSKKLGAIRMSEVEEWIARLRETGLSASRIRNAHYVLTAILQHALKDGRITANPSRGASRPRVIKPERRFLTHHQLHQLADAIGKAKSRRGDLIKRGECYRLLVLTLGYTGLRWGEATALRVRRVDLDRGRLEVVEAVTDVSGNIIRGTTKTHTRRSVPVPEFLINELRVWIEGKKGDALVFPAPGGGYLRNSNFRKRGFDQASKKIGMPGLKPHELRHTAASLAIAAGASIKAVQAMLGHASAKMTLDVYGHLMPDELDAVAARLNAAAVGAVPRDVPQSGLRESHDEPEGARDDSDLQ